MNKEYFDIQMFSEGAAEDGGADGASESGLTGDFDTDFQKYFGKSVGIGSAPVSHEENAESDEETSGTESQESEEADTVENSEGAEENLETDPEKEFEELIKGKYKGAFQKRTQGIINERFKTNKETEGKLSLAMSALAPLFDRYGIEQGDLESLENAIKSDAGIFAKKALEKGIGSEEYRDAFNADRDREQQAEKEDFEKRQQAAREKYEDWKRQEADIRKTYPSFNLENAFGNEEFRNMAMSGASLMNAYRASHFDEITAGLVAAATKRAAKNAVDSMQVNVRRPKEGGMSSSGGAVTKKDVNSLTGNDINEILKQVGRGEKITF